VQGRLGGGGMGDVYDAIDERLGRRVAIKVLHVDRADDPAELKRFEREAHALAKLSHPNIVQVSDSGWTPPEPPFLVLELVDGVSLSQIVTEQSLLAQGRVASIAFQLLSALAVAHRAGIVHRDIKPSNVLIVSAPGLGEMVKLIDFGTAKLIGSPLALTGRGALIGTPAYMAPEQLRGGTIDGRTDLFAVGALMYESLTGQRPFRNDDRAESRAKVVTPLADLRPDLDREVLAVVERAMAYDPAARFADADQMRWALEPWADGNTSSGVVSAPPVPLPKTRPWLRILALALAVIGGVVVGGGIVIAVLALTQ
jgi:serine/threonine protein kinase